LRGSPYTIDCFDDLTPGPSLRVTANDVRTWKVFYRTGTLARSTWRSAAIRRWRRARRAKSSPLA
jgi:hypothetical protein